MPTIFRVALFWLSTTLCTITVIGAGTWGFPVAAQTTTTTSPAPDLLINGLTNDINLIEIYDPTPLSLSGAASVYVDTARTMTTSTVLNRFAHGDRPRTSFPGLIAVHDRSSPLWIVIPIINHTTNDQWVLDLGTRLQGRSINFTGVFLYEHVGRRLMINAMPGTNSKGPSQLPEGSKLPLTLTQHKTALIVLYLIPDGSGQIAFPITLQPNTSNGITKSFWQNPIIAASIAMMGLGLISGLALISRRRSLILIGLYPFSLLAPLFIGTEQAFTAPGDYLPSLFALFPAIQGILFLLAIATTVRQSTTSITRPVLPLAAFGLHLLAIPILLFQPVLFDVWTMPILGSIATLGGISLILPQLKQKEEYSRYLLIVCGLHFIATFWVWLSQEQIITLSFPASLNALGLIAPIQILLLNLSLYLLTQGFLEMSSPQNLDHRRSRHTPQDDAQMAKLRQAKEGFDYNNLLKVIEHERKQLSDARERESLRTEEMRRAKEAADEANRAKSAFLAVISHEIRTPMTGVMGMVKLLLDGTLTKEQHDYVTTIKESGNAMMALLNDILDFEKIESGKMQLEQIDFDLPRLIQSTATLMNGHATSKGLALKIELEDSVPRYVIGDMSRLRQVLLNLIGNAIKFTRQGSVTIRLSAAQKPQEGAERTQYQIYFAVQDTGIGISQEGQKNIFNPFTQADKSIARKFGGSGLGLAISRRLIETMGSQININSREGEGTTFFFTLTLPEGSQELAQNNATTTPTPPPSTISSDRAHYRMLIVDDNEITQRVIRALLEQHGHHVSVCGSGEEALALLGSGARFDTIFSDIQMPGMSGHEFSRRVRQMTDPISSTTPIIALTGNVDPTDIQHCYDSGMNDHIAKPIDPDRLISVLNTIETGSFRNPSTIIRQTAPSSITTYNTPTQINDREGSPEKNISEEQDHIMSSDRSSLISDDTLQTSQSPSSSDMTPIAFQSDMLDTLRESLGVDQLADMLKGLFDKADEILNLLADLSQEPYAFDEIRARAHELKGMCGNFGLMSLSHLAAQIEKQARIQEGQNIKALINELPTRYAQGRQEIDAWLKS